MTKINQYNKLTPEEKKIVVCISYDLKYGKYSVTCVPENCAADTYLVYHPVAWRGLPNDKLEEITGVPGAYMCHSSGRYSLHTSYAAAFSIGQRLKELYDRKIGDRG
jgi:uncharacterized UPF0160 family protein